jgi:hypothetical protein
MCCLMKLPDDSFHAWFIRLCYTSLYFWRICVYDSMFHAILFSMLHFRLGMKWLKSYNTLHRYFIYLLIKYAVSIFSEKQIFRALLYLEDSCFEFWDRVADIRWLQHFHWFPSVPAGEFVYTDEARHKYFFLIPFYLQAVQIRSANGVKLLEEWRGVLSSTPPYK